MRKWAIALALVLLSCLPILLARSASPSLLRDSDTVALLHAIQERHSPLSWFATDWPLQNHFYRPIPTLLFEMDNALYGNRAAGYGWTQFGLAIGCVLALFWFLRELTNSLFLTASSSVLFAFWVGDFRPDFSAICGWLAGLVLLAGLFRHGFRVGRFLPAVLVLTYLPVELSGVFARGGGSLAFRIVDWLPGRTASVMTLFALVAMAAYARYERTGATQAPLPDPGPLDPPATRSSVQSNGPSPRAPLWMAVSIAAGALALASYEQAVMLPAATLGLALTMRFQRYRVRWGWQPVFWLLLVGYLVLRYATVPSTPSGYQLQQFRHKMPVLYAIFDYVFPLLAELPGFFALMSVSFIMLGGIQARSFILLLTSNAVALAQARRRWIFALAGWALSIVAYLPMAWQKPFEHYHLWPMAMRSVLVSALIWVAWDLIVIAVSRPARQAPPRLSPAPGSLPRP